MKTVPQKEWIVFTMFLIFCSGCITTDTTDEILWEPLFNTSYEIRNISIIDGDTIHADAPNGQRITIRTLGIDTPELDPDDNNLYEYDSILNLSCLASFAHQAKEMSSSLLSSKKGYIIFDDDAGIKDQYGRYLCYIINQTSVDIGHFLIQNGLARVYNLESFERKNTYQSSERNAIANQTGLWGCT
jgi:micrococcal nuclease